MLVDDQGKETELSKRIRSLVRTHGKTGMLKQIAQNLEGSPCDEHVDCKILPGVLDRDLRTHHICGQPR